MATKKVTKNIEKVVKPTVKASSTAKKVVALAAKKVTSKDCASKKCPIHGSLTTRGRVFEGVVVSDKMQGTVSVRWSRQVRVPKYERYLTIRTKVLAHNPACIVAKTGDVVRIAECRPISKTVSFVVIDKLKEAKK